MKLWYAQVDGAYAGRKLALAVAVPLVAISACILRLGGHDLVYDSVMMWMIFWMLIIPSSNLGIPWLVAVCCPKLSICAHLFISNFGSSRFQTMAVSCFLCETAFAPTLWTRSIIKKFVTFCCVCCVLV